MYEVIRVHVCTLERITMSLFTADHLTTVLYLLTTILYFYGVGTNSGMDYWNGTLDWTTGLSCYSFWTCF